jgi:hypothetical protein
MRPWEGGNFTQPCLRCLWCELPWLAAVRRQQDPEKNLKFLYPKVIETQFDMSTFFDSTRIWTQGLVLVRQGFYSHVLSPGSFWRMYLLCSRPLGYKYNEVGEFSSLDPLAWSSSLVSGLLILLMAHRGYSLHLQNQENWIHSPKWYSSSSLLYHIWF